MFTLFFIVLIVDYNYFSFDFHRCLRLQNFNMQIDYERYTDSLNRLARVVLNVALIIVDKLQHPKFNPDPENPTELERLFEKSISGHSSALTKLIESIGQTLDCKSSLDETNNGLWWLKREYMPRLNYSLIMKRL